MSKHSASITPIRPIVQERVILHVISDEFELAGKAIAIALQRGLEEGSFTFVTFFEGQPNEREFQVRRRPPSIEVRSRRINRATRDAVTGAFV